ncbi:MAG: hypothetical protein R3D98_17505 [Candidatus Krumholzibacteriia bacterium]
MLPRSASRAAATPPDPAGVSNRASRRRRHRRSRPNCWPRVAARPLGGSGELLLDLRGHPGGPGQGPRRHPSGCAALADADPVLAMVTVPRLLSPRVEQLMGWQPPLAEVMRLLAAALQAGLTLPLSMLVGHVETFPERVEHLMRLRDLRQAGRGAVVLEVVLAVDGDLPRRDGRLLRVAQAARPAEPALERRHARALAALTLGHDTVLR